MARLLIGSSLRSIVERWPAIHRCVWAAEAALFGVFLFICWCLPLSGAQALAAGIMSRVGPRQDKHRHVRRNLSIAFPDWTDAERDALGRSLWGNVGKVFAEYVHLFRIRRAVAQRVELIGGEWLEALARQNRSCDFRNGTRWKLGNFRMRSPCGRTAVVRRLHAPAEPLSRLVSCPLPASP